MTLRLVIFASGVGTNADALMQYAADKDSGAEVVALISDRANAKALEKAKAYGIPAHHVPHKKTDELLTLLQTLRPDWAFLAGYMRILPKPVIDFFHSKKLGHARILNIHPSLLPKYPGLNAYEQAFASGDPESGITVHVVDDLLDHGPILLQRRYPRRTGDDFKKFRARGRSLEHGLYVEALRQVVSGGFRLRQQGEGAE